MVPRNRLYLYRSAPSTPGTNAVRDATRHKFSIYLADNYGYNAPGNALVDG